VRRKSGLLTRADLIAICHRLGYPVSARQITDWVHKGLLPPLQQRGRGRGRGKEYFWSDRDVVAQAVVVWTYLAWTHRTELTRLLTWFAGFPVSIDLVRATWLRLSARDWSAMTAKFPDPFERDEWIRRTVRRRRNPANQQAWPVMLATTVMLALWSDDFDPLAALTGRDEDRLKRELEQFLLASEGELHAVRPSALDTVKRGLHFLHYTFSPQHRTRLVAEATPADLRAAQHDWKVLTRFAAAALRSVLPATVTDPSVSGTAAHWAAWRPLWWRLVANLAPSAILLDSALRQAGYGAKIDASIAVLTEVHQTLNRASELGWTRRTQAISPRLIQNMRRLLDQLLRIWEVYPD